MRQIHTLSPEVVRNIIALQKHEDEKREKKQMPIIARDTSGGKDFVPAPEGLHAAVCVDVVDLGMVKSELFGTKHKIYIAWQIDELGDDGKPYLVIKRYTLSLHKKSNLTKDLQTWRGREFTDEERKGFDVEKLLGVNCQLQIFHNKTHDAVYANVQVVLPASKGAPKLVSRDYERVKDRPDYKASVVAEEVSVFADIPF